MRAASQVGKAPFRAAGAPLPARGAGARAAALAAAALLLLVTPATARGPRGPDVHRPDGDCFACHTADAATLRRDPARARDLVAPDLDARCSACHAAEGPSHGTGMPPKGRVPPDLPLSSGGLITCATCHYVHGEGSRASDYERIDNRRGGLCLACHRLSELQ